MDSSYFRFSTRSSAVLTAKNRRALLVVLIAGLAAIMSPQARARCGWDGLAQLANTSSSTILLDLAALRMHAARIWFEDPRNPYPLETRMGMHETAVAGRGCVDNVFRGLSGQLIDVVYEWPASATPLPSGATGFRIPSSNPSVSFDMEFPGATLHRSGGLLLGTSSLPVNQAGNLNGWSLPSFALKVSVVKTANFTGDRSKAFILNTGGLGTLTYYSASDPSRPVSYNQKLQFPSVFTDGGSIPRPPNYLQGQTSTPYCQFAPGGLGFNTITLSPVSTSAFSGIGPANHSATSEKIRFECFGLADLQPKIYFDATYPLGNGSEGVGMETGTSDVGVQLTFDGQPVALGALNPLPINVVLRDSPNPTWATHPLLTGYYDVRGRFCLPGSNCTGDMTQPDWIYIQPKEVSTNAEVQFNYYQTTVQAPLAGAVRVPFSVTVDVQ